MITLSYYYSIITYTIYKSFSGPGKGKIQIQIESWVDSRIQSKCSKNKYEGPFPPNNHWHEMFFSAFPKYLQLLPYFNFFWRSIFECKNTRNTYSYSSFCHYFFSSPYAIFCPWTVQFAFIAIFSLSVNISSDLQKSILDTNIFYPLQATEIKWLIWCIDWCWNLRGMWNE